MQSEAKQSIAQQSNAKQFKAMQSTAQAQHKHSTSKAKAKQKQCSESFRELQRASESFRELQRASESSNRRHTKAKTKQKQSKSTAHIPFILKHHQFSKMSSRRKKKALLCDAVTENAPFRDADRVRFIAFALLKRVWWEAEKRALCAVLCRVGAYHPLYS